MQDEKITVLVVDDHPLLRSGVAAVLQSEPDIVLVGEAETGLKALESFRAHRPDVTLMDIQMSDMNGIETISAIRAEFPTSRFIILTTYHGDAQAVRALKAGATGYLLKTMLREELVRTIRKVHAGQRVIPPEVAAGIAQHVADDVLSEREIDILRMVSVGTSNKMIASKLQLAEATVKSHMQSVLSKLGANDRTHAVTIAMKRGFLEG